MAIKGYIYKGFPKAVFSVEAALNLVPSDFGDDMIVIAPDSDQVKRLPTATGSLPSPMIFGEYSITFNIKKTSPQYQAYKARIASNTLLDGQVDVYDDTNGHYTFQNLSIKSASFNASGNDAVVQFILQGNRLINNDLIAAS